MSDEQQPLPDPALPPEQSSPWGASPPAEPAERPGRRYWLPLVLFLATCASTYYVGGPWYFACLMTTLSAHELGHFIQAVRYRVPASLPMFLPMPFNLFGTFGAVIFMQPHAGDRKAVFDIGITGPIAGLIPALVFSTIGLYLSTVEPIKEGQAVLHLGEPLLFKGLGYLIYGPLPAGHEVMLHPMAFAGWVGIFITALNLIPIGQLDGGHVLYALWPQRAHLIAAALFLGAILGMLALQYYGWMLMIMLLALMGTRHPPTQDDTVPLGAVRIALGWCSLAFLIVGFTPTPVIFGN